MRVWAVGKQKLQTSLRICLQVMICLALVLPFVDHQLWKLTVLSMFFCFNYFVYPQWGLPFTIFYSCSFCSLLWYIWVPFDLACINGFLIQAPFVYFTGTTCHHYLAEIVAGQKLPRNTPL